MASEPHNPLSDKGLSRLMSAVDQHYDNLDTLRTERRKRVQRIVGHHYGQDGAPSPRIMPLSALAYRTLAFHCVARSPRVIATSHVKQLRPESKALQVTMNQQLSAMGFAKSLRRIFSEGMVGLGVAKVGMALHTGSPDFNASEGVPFVEAIDPDDWVQDTSARRWEEITFCGHRYTVPAHIARQSEIYDQDVLRDLPVDSPTAYNRDGGKKTSSVVRGEDGLYETVCDTLTFWALWIPQYNLYVTVPDAKRDAIVSGGEWRGPPSGPFRQLVFTEVPGNCLPLPPLAVCDDIDQAANLLFNKVVQQSKDAKQVGFVRPHGTDDAERVVAAADGDIIKIDSPEAIGSLTFGGPNQALILVANMLKDMFSYFSGNLESLGGLGPQSGTATQDELLAQSASKQIEDMQGALADFTREVVRDIAWYRWHDFKRVDHVEIYVPGVRQPFSEVFGPNRMGRWVDYSIDIEPYSMQHRSPQQRMQAILRVITQVAMPMAPMMQQQGASIDFERIMEVIRDYEDLPELDDIIRWSEPATIRREGDPSQSPAHTTRTYERVNRPGATRQQKDMAMSNMLAGVGQQPAEAASLLRAVG